MELKAHERRRVRGRGSAQRALKCPERSPVEMAQARRVYTEPVVSNARAILIGLALIAVIVNLLQFRSIEQSTDPRYAAFGQLSAPSLQKSLSESPEIADIYNFYFELAKLSPGSKLHMAEDSAFPIP